ncbi:MAG: hypothetical protein IJ899_08540, partial [Blautia sp.]|nr:hypothetical protein [Blautia sp.]
GTSFASKSSSAALSSVVDARIDSILRLAYGDLSCEILFHLFTLQSLVTAQVERNRNPGETKA